MTGLIFPKFFHPLKKNMRSKERHTGVSLRTEVVVLATGGWESLEFVVGFSLVSPSFSLPGVAHVVVAETLVLAERAKCMVSLFLGVDGEVHSDVFGVESGVGVVHRDHEVAVLRGEVGAPGGARSVVEVALAVVDYVRSLFGIPFVFLVVHPVHGGVPLN